MCAASHGPTGFPAGLPPFAFRRLFVELVDVGKFLSRRQDSRRRWSAVVSPLSHHAGDIDCHKLEIGRQVFAIAPHPVRFIGESNDRTLDDTTTCALDLAFDSVFVRLKPSSSRGGFVSSLRILRLLCFYCFAGIFYCFAGITRPAALLSAHAETELP